MKNIRDIIWNLILITAGSVISAVAINGILVPKQFLAGGFTGLALLIHYALPFIPLGATYFILNIPVFIFGWMFVGRRFFFYSIAGMLIYSLAVLIPFPEIMEKMGRGVTVVHGEGGYSGKEQKILYSVIPFQELARFKDLIRKIDPKAFVVINQTLEVMGQKIGNQPHW
ncbi:MAG: YitT family protein [Desulfobacterales bacterium]|jgi:uncharacterized membrane-anchored protein YitT (DUF2179 family)